MNIDKNENISIEESEKSVDKSKASGVDNVLRKKPHKKLSSGAVWTIKITITTFCLTILVTFITNITSSKSNVIISILILCLLITLSIVFDAIGVAATSCDPKPLMAMAARKVKGAKTAVKLVRNAEKVANICADVIGDMSGIISGTCTAAIILKFAAEDPENLYLSIGLTSLVSAVTVGGKAFFKSIAMKNAKDMMLFSGKVLELFYRPKK